jgi:hypothetical protein
LTVFTIWRCMITQRLPLTVPLYYRFATLSTLSVFAMVRRILASAGSAIAVSGDVITKRALRPSRANIWRANPIASISICWRVRLSGSSFGGLSSSETSDSAPDNERTEQNPNTASR